MNVEEFVNRMDEAEKVLKYTFRLNFAAADQELKKLQAKNEGCWLKQQQNRHTGCLRHLFLTDGTATHF